MEIAAASGLIEARIVASFDSYRGTPAELKLSKDLLPKGVNLFAGKAARPNYSWTKGHSPA
ncbi:MAG: hypothetical protein HY695_26495 [Deltaproteobacteria bacterium]|nr:hypothetical protein [Deltaproteobacteria bacterium]